MSAHCARVSLSGVVPKCSSATAAAPYMPLPISMQLRYTSIMRSLPQMASMSRVK